MLNRRPTLDLSLLSQVGKKQLQQTHNHNNNLQILGVHNHLAELAEESYEEQNDDKYRENIVEKREKGDEICDIIEDKRQQMKEWLVDTWLFAIRIFLKNCFCEDFFVL